MQTSTKNPPVSPHILHVYLKDPLDMYAYVDVTKKIDKQQFPPFHHPQNSQKCHNPSNSPQSKYHE